MILENITLHNFGLYKGRQSINLAPPSPKKPVVLLGGQNGAGKTTLLDALLLAMYGNLARCSNRGNQAYDKYLLSCINKNVSSKDGAALEIQFKHKLNGSEDTYNLRRLWSQNGKGVKEYLEIYKNDKLDNVLSEEWNNYVEEIIPYRIANLFFFDGEKIEEFADISNSSELLSTAINSLLGVDIIDKLLNDLVVLKRRRKTIIKDHKIQDEIKELEAELGKLKDLRSDVKQNIASISNQISFLTKEKEKLEGIIREGGGDLFEQRDLLDKQKENAKLRICALEEELRIIASGLAPLLLIPDLISEIIEQDMFERHVFETDNLIELLAERDSKIIDKMKLCKISESVIGEITEYLSDDRDTRREHHTTETYLDISTDCRNRANSLHAGLFEEIRSKVIATTNELRELYVLVDNIDRKLAGVPEEETIYEKINERQEIQFNIDKAVYENRLLQDKLKKLDWDIDQKSRRLVKHIESSIEAEFKNEDIYRIMEYSNKVADTLKKFRIAIIISHTGRIAELILDSFRKLIRKQSLVRNLKINPETFSLELRDRDGNLLKQDRLSAGERQLLAVSILWGLARASGRPLPTAIDTPLGRLDSEHRCHLVERYFPFASHQVLLFSTDEEIRDKYLEKLKPFIGHSYYLDYDDSKGYTEIRKGYFLES